MHLPLYFLVVYRSSLLFFWAYLPRGFVWIRGVFERVGWRVVFVFCIISRGGGEDGVVYEIYEDEGGGLCI